MQFLLLIFILVPIIEIGVFIQVGDVLGLWPTILIVFITAIIGVNLLKQQGLRAWSDIQNSMAQGKVPALEMASAAQLLFAGGLLLTPGFVTDIIGFTLMVPAMRMMIAKLLMSRWTMKMSSHTIHSGFHNQFDNNQDTFKQSPFGDTPTNKANPIKDHRGRVIEGDFEDRSS